MPYSEERKAYARQWYAKNKARLLADPARIEARKLRNKRYYKKHSEKLKAKTKKYNKDNEQKVKERKKQYWLDHRDEFIEYQKNKRQTEEYKSYMKAYREKNRDKINQQEKLSSARFIRKQIENLTDTYIVSQISLSKSNTLSISELRQRPDLIEKKRAQIMAHRQKFGPVQMEIDIIAEIEAAQKKRDEQPFSFTYRPDHLEDNAYSRRV